MVGRGWVLRRLMSQQARGPPCPPALVSDVSSAPLGAAAAPGPAPRPESDCAGGTRERAGLRELRGAGQTTPKAGSPALAGAGEQTSVRVKVDPGTAFSEFPVGGTKPGPNC